ncbi:hypothetical protein [Sphingomonas prati]|uniref:Uncharacterized protein n=1 Tax=Sphingomonas prati TaxID=1843237 RepID=A0A7W9BWH4_9SPHN|nr:hypothetical protein [Sphingomonas prati]MBB5730943.1 hypothetical protein [Sphingomonas prati]GGE97833.1 hypothetical protein GCM10011404_33690 [Sphingomonas prati]
MLTNAGDPAMPGAAFPRSDPYGQAALLLVESLIHGLCENSTLSSDQAVEIVQRALEMQLARANEADGTGVPMPRSHALLLAILASFRTDQENKPIGPRLV